MATISKYGNDQTAIAEAEAAFVLVTLNAQQYVDTTYRFRYYGLRIDQVTWHIGGHVEDQFKPLGAGLF